jgi:O-antigen/teichoic acid export membrane protein
VIVYLVVVIVVNLLKYPQVTKELIYISGLVMIFDSFVLTTYSLLRGLQRLKYEAMGVILNQVSVMLIGVTGLLFITRNLKLLMVAFLVGSFVNLVFALYNLHKNYNVKLQLTWDIKIIKHIYFISIPFALSGIFTRVYSYIDALILRGYLGEKSVGWYTVAYKIPFALQFIPSAFAAAIYPAISKFFKSSQEKLEKTWHRSMTYLMIISMPMMFGIYSLSDVVILKFYGAEYENSILILQVLIFGLFFIFLNFPQGSLLNACNRQTMNTILIGCTMVINIISNVILIPMIDTLGAAVAFLISHGFLFISSLIVARSIIKINALDLVVKFIKILIACIIMTIIVYYFKNNISWILSIPVGAIIYAIFILLFKTMPISEIKGLVNKFIK